MKVSELTDLEKRLAVSSYVIPAKTVDTAAIVKEIVESRGGLQYMLDLKTQEIFEDKDAQADKDAIVSRLTNIPVIV